MSDAEDLPDGVPKALLELDWTLIFGSHGGMGAKVRHRMKITNNRCGADSSNALSSKKVAGGGGRVAYLDERERQRVRDLVIQNQF